MNLPRITWSRLRKDCWVLLTKKVKYEPMMMLDEYNETNAITRCHNIATGAEWAFHDWLWTVYKAFHLPYQQLNIYIKTYPMEGSKVTKCKMGSHVLTFRTDVEQWTLKSQTIFQIYHNFFWSYVLSKQNFTTTKKQATCLSSSIWMVAKCAYLFASYAAVHSTNRFWIPISRIIALDAV